MTLDGVEPHVAPRDAFQREPMRAQEDASGVPQRKRGKLAEFNHVLRGTGSDAFSTIVGDLALLQRVRYVITLDSDTVLPPEAAALLGTVFSRRFVPTMGGTLLSALFIGFLANGFQLLSVSSYWVAGVQGALILLVVAVTSFARPQEH